jgi:hypothetical protein
MTSPPIVNLDTERAHGLHLGTAQAGSEKIKWRKWGPTAKATVVETTCTCKARVYELGHAGGERYIARIDRAPDQRDVILYAGPMLAGKADRLWQKILTGEAR